MQKVINKKVLNENNTIVIQLGSKFYGLDKADKGTEWTCTNETGVSRGNEYKDFAKGPFEFYQGENKLSAAYTFTGTYSSRLKCFVVNEGQVVDRAFTFAEDSIPNDDEKCTLYFVGSFAKGYTIYTEGRANVTKEEPKAGGAGGEDGAGIDVAAIIEKNKEKKLSLNIYVEEEA